MPSLAGVPSCRCLCTLRPLERLAGTPPPAAAPGKLAKAAAHPARLTAALQMCAKVGLKVLG